MLKSVHVHHLANGVTFNLAQSVSNSAERSASVTKNPVNGEDRSRGMTTRILQANEVESTAKNRPQELSNHGAQARSTS
jgi:hypothetical protein